MKYTTTKSKQYSNGTMILPNQRVQVDRKLMRMDDARKGRLRLYHDEMESVNAVQAAQSLLIAHVYKLARVSAKEEGLQQRFESVRDELVKCLERYMAWVSLEQTVSMKNNAESAKVCITSAPMHGCINIAEPDAVQLVKAARHQCADCMDCMSKPHWMECKLRKVLDGVMISECELQRQNVADDVCPYTQGV